VTVKLPVHTKGLNTPTKSIVKLFNILKTMPQAKFNLKIKKNTLENESGKAIIKTHLEVSKNSKEEAKKFKPSVGQQNIPLLPNQNPNESKEKNTMGQHSPLEKKEKKEKEKKDTLWRELFSKGQKKYPSVE
jgi:hypothetical protein